MVLKAGIVGAASLATTAMAYNQTQNNGNSGSSNNNCRPPVSVKKSDMSWSQKHRETIQQQNFWK